MTREQLEAKVNQIPAKFDLFKLADDQIFALLAWELWKDGMDWDDDLASLAEGKGDMQYKTREDCVNYLKTVFGY